MSLLQSGQCVFEHRLEDPYFSSGDCGLRSAWGRPFALAGDGRHVLVCSGAGGVIYEMMGGGGGGASAVAESPAFEKVLGLKGHRRHTTCTDWSAAADCGPCITAGSDGHVRVSTLLSQ